MIIRILLSFLVYLLIRPLFKKIVSNIEFKYNILANKTPYSEESSKIYDKKDTILTLSWISVVAFSYACGWLLSVLAN